MYLDLKCLEWQNVAKNARLLKQIKKKKSQGGGGQSAASSGSGLTASFLSQLAASSNDKYLAGLFSPVVNVYDQAGLRLTSQIKAAAVGESINEIGFFKQSDRQLFASKDNSTLDVWDLREVSSAAATSDNSTSSRVAISFGDFLTDKREFLCADVSADDTLLIVGTNKTIDDSLIYIFDIRYNTRYVHKFCESHSNDVTQVKFNPSVKSKFCSASLDGLVCLYDLNQKPDDQPAPPTDTKSESKSSSDSDDDDNESNGEEEDPDLMEVALNTDSSVKRIGYLSTTSQVVDQLYAITFTNDLFVWDLASFDTVYKKQTKNKNVVSGESIDENEQLEESYFFDCFYNKSHLQQSTTTPPVLTVCMSDSNGTIRLYQKDEVVFETVREDGGRSHRDIIRSSYWNGQNLFTAAEDGFLIKWNVQAKSTRVCEESSRVGNKPSIKRDRVTDGGGTKKEIGNEDSSSSDTEVKKKKKKKNINKSAVKFTNKK